MVRDILVDSLFLFAFIVLCVVVLVLGQVMKAWETVKENRVGKY